MELLKFYYIIAAVAEIAVILPVILGLKKWKKLNKGLRFFLLLLIAEWILNLIGIYYAIFAQTNNLFLSYYYSSFWNFLGLGFLMQLLPYKKTVSVLMILSGLLILFEYFFFAEPYGMNYTSGLVISINIFFLSFFAFFILFNQDYSSDRINPMLLILLGLMVQFFVRGGDMFFKKLLLQTSLYANLWYYETIIYYYFMLMVVGIFSYGLYSLKNHA
jgi:hypothetical protein